MRYFFLSAFYLISINLCAQKHFFDQYTIRDGLKSNYIVDVTQTCNGLIAISTFGGISVLYPSSIKTFSEEDGLLSNISGRVFPLKDDVLVVNSVDGYSVLDIHRNNIVNVKSKDKRPLHAFSFGDGIIYSLEGSKSTSLYTHHIKDSLIVNAKITDVLKDGDFILISTADKGIIQYDVVNKKAIKIPTKFDKAIIYELQHSNDGVIAVSGTGIYQLNLNSDLQEHEVQYEELSGYHGYMLHYGADNTGNEWIAGHFTGVFRVNDEEVVLLEEKNGFTSSKVTKIFKDREGNMWFGTMGQGIFMDQNNPFSLLNQTSFNLTINNVSAFEITGNKYVIGYAPGGVEILDTTTAEKAYYSFYNSALTDDNILLLEKIDDEIYGVAINQLFKIGETIENIKKSDDLNFYRGRNLIKHQDKLYLSSSIGILEYSKNDNYLISSYLPQEDPEVFYISVHEDQILFTTRKGLFKLDPLNKKATHLYVDSVEYLYNLAGDGFSAFFSKEGTFLTIDPSGEVKKFNINKISGPIQSVASSRGFSYIFTDGSYYIYKTIDLLSGTFKPIETGTHGFDIFPNSVKIFGNDIFLGSSEGLLKFKPLFNKSDSVAPAVIVEFPKQFIPDENGIYHIPRNKRGEVFQVYALDYKTGHNTKLKVSNAGNILSSSNNFLEFSGKLDPGWNTLEIQATDKAGNVSIEKASFYLEPFWWETSWFKVLIGLMGVGTLASTYFLVMKQREGKILRQEKNKRAIEEQLRENVAMDFHDELGNNLAILNVHIEKLRIQVNENSSYNPILDDIRTSYRKIFENSKDLVWALNPASDNLSEILIRGKDYGERLFKDSEIQFKCINLLKPNANLMVRSSAAKDLMYIIKESFTNAYKHSGATEVTFLIWAEDNSHYILITDNGHGIPQNHPNGRGLRYIQKRVDRINYRLQISTTNGTELKISGEAL